jgi:hypothetical protein
MKNLLLYVVFIALAIGAYFLGRNESSYSNDQDSNSFAQSQPIQASPELHASIKNTKSEPKISLPLPPENLPLAEVYTLLQNRADAGDSKAACRLAIELMRCQKAFNMKKFQGDNNLAEINFDDFVTPVDNLKYANDADESNLLLLNKLQSCKNISSNQLKQTFRYLRQAAYASEPDAMIMYVEGMGMEGEGGMSSLRGKDLDVWRQDANLIAERSLRQGLPEAVLLFNSAYSEDFSLFSGLIENDPVKAEAMQLLLLKLQGEPFPSKTKLNASDYQKALSSTEQMFASYFGSKRVPNSEFSKRITPYAVEGDESMPLCE